MYEINGVIHIHTKYSDGSGSVKDIVKAASEVDLDFIMLTDHNTLAAKEEGNEGWQKNVMVIVGYELNDEDDKNHYLVFGLDELPPKPFIAKNYVKFVNKNGGLGFIAHPNEKRKHLEKHPPYPWTDWEVEGFTGIELWNHMSEWMEGLTDSNKFNRLIHPLKSIKSPSEDTLKLFDDLNNSGPVVGIGSVDAHAHKQDLMGFLNLEIFPYKVLFKSIRTHILLPDKLGKRTDKYFEKQKKDILSSLKKGHCFVSNYYHGNAKGFRFFATGKKKRYIMGDTFEIKKGEIIMLEALSPFKGDIYLIKDGEKIFHVNGLEMTYDCKKPGNYRIEIFKEKQAWIYSNHIRIQEKK
jgi:hypothetical protein